MDNLKSMKASGGFSLIEVLVTVFIVSIGLLGLAGLQLSSLGNQLESYQRAQAMLLIQDMSNRMRANPDAARNGEYLETDVYGTGAEIDCSALTDTTLIDMCNWHGALQGTGVVVDGENLGSLVGARGCIENIAGSGDGEVIIRLTIAWQGMSATAAPASTCGQGSFGTDDAFRRTVSIDTVIADLTI